MSERCRFYAQARQENVGTVQGPAVRVWHRQAILRGQVRDVNAIAIVGTGRMMRNLLPDYKRKQLCVTRAELLAVVWFFSERLVDVPSSVEGVL